MGHDHIMLAKNGTPVTLTLTSESVFKFQNLRLGFENSLLSLQLRYMYTVYVCHTLALGQDLTMNAKSVTPVTLTLIL